MVKNFYGDLGFTVVSLDSEKIGVGAYIKRLY
jgi:hypothetical protein